MIRCWKEMMLAGVLLCVMPGFAQTTVTTIGGTANTVPLYTGSSTLSNSVITQSGSNVGIGTTTPGAPLQVVGTGWVLSLGEASNSAGHQVLFGINNSGNGYGEIQSVYENVAYTPLILNPSGGNVGVGTVSPSYPLDVVGNIRFGAGQNGGLPRGYLGNTWGGDGFRFAYIGSSNFDGTNWITDENAGYGSNYVSEITLDAGGGGIRFFTQPASNNTQRTDSPSTFNSYERMRIDQNGNMGIGTASPGAKLELNGNLKLTSGSGASITFADGTVQSTAYTGGELRGRLCGVGRCNW